MHDKLERRARSAVLNKVIDRNVEGLDLWIE